MQNRKFIELLESVLKQWKDENDISRPVFYSIEHKTNNLLIFSDQPDVVIPAIDDLRKMLDIASIRFRDVQAMRFRGGVIV